MRHLSAALALMVSAAVAAPAAAQAAKGPNVVTINAYDYFYEAPNPIPAGVTTLRLVNKGKEYHHVWVVKIAEGYAFSDFMAAQGPGRATPTWLTGLGGPESPEPGSESSVTLDLEPGRYALACLLSARAEHVTHMNKGMFLPLTVTKAKGKMGVEPKADAEVIVRYDGMEAPNVLRAGKRVIKARGVGAQARGFRIARIADGKTSADADAWVAAGATGPAPFTLFGGTTPLGQGVSAYITVTLTPGNYSLMPMEVDGSSGELVYSKTKGSAVTVWK
jgi:hypothetical protein